MTLCAPATKLWVVCQGWTGNRAVSGGALHIVHIEGGEGVLAGGVAVPVRQRAQLLQALGDGACEAVLPGHVCVQQHVLGRLALVAAVGAPQLLHLPQGSMHVR